MYLMRDKSAVDSPVRREFLRAQKLITRGYNFGGWYTTYHDTIP